MSILAPPTTKPPKVLRGCIVRINCGYYLSPDEFRRMGLQLFEWGNPSLEERRREIYPAYAIVIDAERFFNTYCNQDNHTVATVIKDAWNNRGFQRSQDYLSQLNETRTGIPIDDESPIQRELRKLGFDYVGFAPIPLIPDNHRSITLSGATVVFGHMFGAIYALQFLDGDKLMELYHSVPHEYWQSKDGIKMILDRNMDGPLYRNSLGEWEYQKRKAPSFDTIAELKKHHRNVTRFLKEAEANDQRNW